MKKVTIAQYTQFCREFSVNPDRDLRFGQAFLNTFFPSISDPEVFYEENTKAVAHIIFQRYITLEVDHETVD